MTATTTYLVPAAFSIEGDPTAPTFAGYHDPADRWNGWAQPYFTREVVYAVARMVHADPHFRADFTWDGDVVVVTEYDEDGEQYGDEPTRLLPYVVDGVALYDLGLGWVWDTVDTGR